MYIAIDIGGTNTRVASSSNLNEIIKVETFPSHKELSEQKTLLRSTIDKILGGEKSQGYVVGTPGVVDKVKGQVLKTSNYHSLDGVLIRDLIGEPNKAVPVLCGNDTEIAALGEAVLGAGQPFNSVAYLSLGTGVGGALIGNKTANPFSKMFEPGHQIINMESEVSDGVGISGSLETYISGPAFERLYKVKPEGCQDEKVWSEYGKHLGVGIHNLVMLWNPDCVVIGGGMAAHFEKFNKTAVKFLEDLNYVSVPKILKSKFGQGSGLTGGFVLLSQLTG